MLISNIKYQILNQYLISIVHTFVNKFKKALRIDEE